MTQEQQPDPRKLAGDALELASAATKGPWDDNGQFEIIAGRGFPLFYHFEAEFYEPEENMTDDKVTANLAFVAYARGLVPGLATALLAALDEVERLKGENTELEQALHVAPVKYQLAIANHIFMIDAGLCLEVIAPLAHTELMRIGKQILDGVGQYNIQDQLETEVKRLKGEVERLEKVVLAQMANESQLMGLYEDFDNGEELDTQPVSLRELEAEILKAVENIGTQE